MAVDWITVAAQIINFLVLIWLLKRFLYRPILDGIDAREAEIEARIATANDAKTKANAAEAAYRIKLETFENRKSKLLNTVREEAEREREALQTKAKQALDKSKVAWSEQMAEMKADYANDLRAAGARAILSLTRKALNDLSDVKLEERMVTHLENRFAELADELRTAAGPVEEAIVFTSFHLSKKSRAHFAKTFKDTIADIPLHFKTDHDQSPGIVLHLGGGRLGWTIDSYLDGMDAMLTDQLVDQTKNAGSI
jgi:F-type H+-transporting ATPase subunit b